MLIVLPDKNPDILSTNVAASAKTAWSDTKPYTIGNEVKHLPAGSVWAHEFRCKQDHTDQEPIVKGSDYWLDLGVVNQHKMFDGYNNSRTVGSSADIVIRLKIIKRTQYVGLLGLRDTSNVKIEQFVDDVSVAVHERNLMQTISPVGWWTWLFGERAYAHSHMQKLYGVFSTQEIEITLTGLGAAQIALCVVGQSFDIGKTITGPRPRLQSYSTFEPNEFGNYEYVPRQNTRTADFTVAINTAQINRVYQIMELYEDRLLLVDGNNETTNFDALRVFGKIVDFAPGIEYEKTLLDLKVEGLN